MYNFLNWSELSQCYKSAYILLSANETLTYKYVYNFMLFPFSDFNTIWKQKKHSMLLNHKNIIMHISEIEY